MSGNVLFNNRRQRVLLLVFTILILITAAIIALLCFLLKTNGPKAAIVACQFIIPLLAIVIAGLFVSMPGKIIRSKFLLLVMFILLMFMGIFIYSGQLESSKANTADYILYPLNNALSAFFPSRGDYYTFDSSKDFFQYHLYTYNTPYLIFHALAYFYFAWLGFSIFGRKLLNRTALCLLRREHKNLIWGYSEGALELAKDMVNNYKDYEPVFILDDDIEFDTEKDKRIFEKLSNENILAISTHYDNLSVEAKDFQYTCFSWHHLRKLLTSGKYFNGFRHYFITENQDFNVKHALKILTQLSLQKDCLKGRTHLYVRSEQDGIDAFFQTRLKAENLTGLVEVHIFNQSDITARKFVSKYPILGLSKSMNPSTGREWLSINNDTLHVNGEINILLLGLGWTGYEMMKKLVSDAQFIGDYTLNIVVVDNDYRMFHGRYQYIAQEAARFGVNICINPKVWVNKCNRICGQSLVANNDIFHDGLVEKRIHQTNGERFYEWLGFTPEDGVTNILLFNRIIIALGSDELNINTALQLNSFRNRYLGAKEANDRQLMPEPVYAHVRDKESYSYYEDNKTTPICIFGSMRSIYNVNTIVGEKMDQVAKLVNHVYCHSDIEILSENQLRTALDNGEADSEWKECSIFDQDSSRAIATNLGNMVTLAGGIEQLTYMVNEPMFIERLAEMEHKRWNSFHYMRGIGTWNIEDVQPINGKAKGKLMFNGTLSRHICLVDYDKLDEVTRRVNILGNDTDFKENDRRIIRHYPAFYRIIKS